jgi:hypothetical protein
MPTPGKRRGRVPSGNPSTFVLHTYVTAEESMLLRVAASERGLTISQLIRVVLRPLIEQLREQGRTDA